jgi:hypothetical protein
MEIIKKTLPVEEAKGWYLLQNEVKTWTEDVADEETGDVTPTERSEVLMRMGCELTALDVSTLKENGVTEVRVSSMPLKGIKEERVNLWEATLRVRGAAGAKKRAYIVFAESPTAAEAYISGYMEQNVECKFEVVKVAKLEYSRVIKMYESEREEYEASKKHFARWHKAQVASLAEDSAGAEIESASVTLLVQATSFDEAVMATRATLSADEYTSMFSEFKAVQELAIFDVFLPDEEAIPYSRYDLEK